MLHVFARAKSKPGHEDELREVLRALARDSRQEPGVLLYELFETNERGEFLFREQYVDEAAFEAHKRSRHIRRTVVQATPLLDGNMSLWVVDPVSESQETHDVS